MIDPKVFTELMNKGIITNVGLNPNAYKDLNDLKRYGLATSIASEEVYKEAIEEFVNKEEALKEFLNAVANGGEVVLPMDFVLTTPIIIEKDVTIDLNGYSLIGGVFAENNGNVVEGDTDSYVFWVKKGTLTVNGEGIVKSLPCKYSIAVWANGGNVILNGGTYMNGEGCDLIYLSNKGNVEINGGIYEAGLNTATNGTKNKRSAINIKDANRSTCTVSVKGGKFLEFNPADNVSETEHTNFVAEGYESTADGDYFIINKIA